MDRNTELLLLKAAQGRQWEDEERASYDLETMRKEFRQRLYPAAANAPASFPPAAAAEEEPRR